MISCDCPVSAALEGAVEDGCLENIGQIQKILVQRYFDDSGDRNEIDLAATLPAPEEKAFWDVLLTAVDSTKVIATPIIANPDVVPGEIITTGGGDATPSGVLINLGSETTNVSFELHQRKQYIIAALKKLACENVSVALISEAGDIWMASDNGETPTKGYFIPVGNTFFVGDKKTGKRLEQDMNMGSFQFKENWSDTLVKISPTDFNAITDLVNA